MAELELEIIDRAVRWCAEAGRQTTPVEVRAAFANLGWDQLMVVRALLADPPPARPLGPHALADLARGVPPDVASSREREQRYPASGAEAGVHPAPVEAVASAPAARTRPARSSRRAQVVVRKAAAATAVAAAAPARPPLIEELLLPAGRGELGRLIRRHGGRRPRLIAALAAAYRRADGGPIGDADLDAALEHHGLDRAFARRERDELIHAVRAAAGVLARAAEALGHDLPGLRSAISRVGAGAEVARLREARQRDLRGRATIAERAGLLVGSADTLADLGVLEEFERDLKERLPEHLRALATTGGPLEPGLARSLTLPAPTVRELLARLGVELRAPPAVAGPPRDRPSTSRPAGARPAGPRASGDRPAWSRPGANRPVASRSTGDRPGGSRPPQSRKAGGRPVGRSGPGGRLVGGRTAGSRPAGGKPGGARAAGPRRPTPGGGRRGPSR